MERLTNIKKQIKNIKWCDLKVNDFLYYWNTSSDCKEIPCKYKILDIKNGTDTVNIKVNELNDEICFPFENYFIESCGMFSEDIDNGNVIFHIIGSDEESFWKQYNELLNALREHKN